MLLTLALPFGCVGCSDGGSASYDQISGAEAKALMDSESGYIIIDARTQEEYDQGHIPGAIMIPEYEIAVRAENELPDKDQLIVRRNEAWRKVYYEHFENVKGGTPTFASILTHLYESTGNIEPSFSSKMLATIFPDKPIWDRYVVQNLNMELIGTTKEERLENAIVLYANMEKWYADFLQTEKAKECIEVFDRVMPDYKHISNIKKIDSILWSIR